MLFLQRTFYKTEISLSQVRLIRKPQISKIYNLHFSAIKAQEHSGSSIIARFRSNLTQYGSSVSHECVDLTEHQNNKKCLLECSFVTLLLMVC